MSFDKSKIKSLVNNIQLNPPSSLFGEDTFEERIEQLPLSSLRPFRNHPFKVLDDASMEVLRSSIGEFGVANPIIVRDLGKSTYEIVAGHRRVGACTLLGLEEIPGIVRDIDQDEAIFQMVDTNIQREELLPSEKAFAYKMKLDATKRKTGRKLDSAKKNGAQVEPHLKSREMLAQNSSDSAAQIQRYIRLTYLKEDLLQYTDEKKIPFGVAVELSYLSQEEQEMLWGKIIALKKKPNLEQATKLKKCSNEETLTPEVIESILMEGKEKEKSVSLKLDIAQYFPEKTSKAEMEQVILDLLKKWKEKD